MRMSIVTNLSPSWEPAAHAGFARARATQNTGFAGGFDGESPRQSAARDAFHTVFATSGLRQSGTETVVPNRYDEIENPQLSAAFVAQLLGQIMPHRDLNLSKARAAYRKTQHQSAQLLDARL